MRFLRKHLIRYAKKDADGKQQTDAMIEKVKEKIFGEIEE